MRNVKTLIRGGSRGTTNN